MKRLIRQIIGREKEGVPDGRARSIEKQQDDLERQLRQLQTQAALARLRKRREQGAS